MPLQPAVDSATETLHRLVDGRNITTDRNHMWTARHGLLPPNALNPSLPSPHPRHGAGGDQHGGMSHMLVLKVDLRQTRVRGGVMGASRGGGCIAGWWVRALDTAVLLEPST